MTSIRRGSRPTAAVHMRLHRPHAHGKAPVTRIYMLAAKGGVQRVDAVGQVVRFRQIVAKTRCGVGQHLAQRFLVAVVGLQGAAQVAPG